MKHKIDLLYEKMLQEQNHGSEFWNELFLIRAETSHLEKILNDLSIKSLYSKHKELKNSFTEAVKRLNDKNRQLNCILFLECIFRCIGSRNIANYSSDIYKLTSGIEEAENVYNNLAAELVTLLSLYPEATCDLFVSILLTTSNLHSNVLIEYFLHTKIVTALFSNVKNGSTKAFQAFALSRLFSKLDFNNCFVEFVHKTESFNFIVEYFEPFLKDIEISYFEGFVKYFWNEKDSISGSEVTCFYFLYELVQNAEFCAWFKSSSFKNQVLARFEKTIQHKIIDLNEMLGYTLKLMFERNCFESDDELVVLLDTLCSSLKTDSDFVFQLLQSVLSFLFQFKKRIDYNWSGLWVILFKAYKSRQNKFTFDQIDWLVTNCNEFVPDDEAYTTLLHQVLQCKEVFQFKERSNAQLAIENLTKLIGDETDLDSVLAIIRNNQMSFVSNKILNVPMYSESTEHRKVFRGIASLIKNQL